MDTVVDPTSFTVKGGSVDPTTMTHASAITLSGALAEQKGKTYTISASGHTGTLTFTANGYDSDDFEVSSDAQKINVKDTAADSGTITIRAKAKDDAGNEGNPVELTITLGS